MKIRHRDELILFLGLQGQSKRYKTPYILISGKVKLLYISLSAEKMFNKFQNTFTIKTHSKTCIERTFLSIFNANYESIAHVLLQIEK